jgi:hypothetical protein
MEELGVTCFMAPLLHLRTLLGQERAKDRAMAVCFVLAIAPNREVAAVGKRGKKLKIVAGLVRRHFGPVLLDERNPLSRSLGLLAKLHGFDAGCEVWKPHVIPVLRGELGFGDTPRRATNRSNARPFTFDAWTSKPDDTNYHWSLL